MKNNYCNVYIIKRATIYTEYIARLYLNNLKDFSPLHKEYSSVFKLRNYKTFFLCMLR